MEHLLFFWGGGGGGGGGGNNAILCGGAYYSPCGWSDMVSCHFCRIIILTVRLSDFTASDLVWVNHHPGPCVYAIATHYSLALTNSLFCFEHLH